MLTINRMKLLRDNFPNQDFYITPGIFQEILKAYPKKQIDRFVASGNKKLTNTRFIFLRDLDEVDKKTKIQLEKRFPQFDKNKIICLDVSDVFYFDDPKLKKWLDDGGNYGIVGGFGDLIIIDFDDKEFEKEYIDKLPETFTVRTGSGGTHLYYEAIENKSFKILNEKKDTLVDIQGDGKQVVCPNSIHPNGKKYQVIKDISIAKIKRELLQSCS